MASSLPLALPLAGGIGIVFGDMKLQFGGSVYMCYDYVHLDNLSDISTYRTVVKPQHTTM